MFRREMGSKRGSLPPKEGDLTCVFGFTRMLFLLLEIRIFNHIKNEQRTGVGSTNYDTSTIKLDLHNFVILIKEQYHLRWKH